MTELKQYIYIYIYIVLCEVNEFLAAKWTADKAKEGLIGREGGGGEERERKEERERGRRRGRILSKESEHFSLVLSQVTIASIFFNITGERERERGGREVVYKRRGRGKYNKIKLTNKKIKK